MADDLSSRSLSLTIVEVSCLIIVNVLSLTGNTLVCFLFYKTTRLRTTTNLYIIALAVSDLLSAVLVMPFGIGVLITSKWLFGGVICELQALLGVFVIYVSPVTMGLTAVNRYVKICKPDQQYKKLFSARKSRALLASVWIFVACYTVLPRLAGLQAHEFVPACALCAPAYLSESGKIINYGVLLTLFLLTPLISTIISYIKVAKIIRQHNRDVSSTIRRRAGNSFISANEIKLSKSLFVVVFAFMICWIPFWVIVVLRRFHLVAKMPRNVSLLCMFFLYLSNTINPFIYAGMNPAFRGEFRKILFRERRPQIASSKGEARTGQFETHIKSFHRNRERRSETLSEINSHQSSDRGDQQQGFVESFTLDTLGVDNSQDVSGV